MQVFDFTAVDQAGQTVRGRIVAASRTAAVDALAKRGQLAVEIVAGSAAKAAASAQTGWWQRPSTNDVTLWTRELSLLLNGGLSLSASLAAVEAEASTSRVKALSGRLRQTIASGQSLNEALAAEAPVFSPVFVGMIKAAEASGSLVPVLERIAAARETEARLKSKITSALLYPAFLIVSAIMMVLLLFLFVVPRIKDSLGDQVAQLPAASKTVFAMSDWLQAWGVVLMAGLGVAVVLLLILGSTAAARGAWQYALVRLPLIGKLAKMSLAAQFCRTLGALLASGLQLPAALTLTRDVISNQEARALIDKLGVALRSGEEFTVPLSQSGVFPGLVASMLRTGAESGFLAKSAERLAVMYDNKLEIALQRLVTVLEPTIILLISVFISLIVISVMNAIMGLYDLTGN